MAGRKFRVVVMLSNAHRKLNSQLGSNQSNNIFKFDILCTVHRNQFYKQTNKMHFFVCTRVGILILATPR